MHCDLSHSDSAMAKCTEICRIAVLLWQKCIAICCTAVLLRQKGAATCRNALKDEKKCFSTFWDLYFEKNYPFGILTITGTMNTQVPAHLNAIAL